MTNQSGSWPRNQSDQIASAASEKAMNMVGSRPILSDTQPKKGRAKPFSTLSTTNAKVSTVPPMPSKVTWLSATPKSAAMEASPAVTISPPEATSTNITYSSQNKGLF